MIINNILYILLFNDLAEFLILNSTHEVYYVFENSKNKPMLLMNKKNYLPYIEMVNKAYKEGYAKGMFFLKQEIKNVNINVNYSGDININSHYNKYIWLNFK
jgi:hypothetical protein